MIVLWRVTTRCNLSCAFCAYDRSLPYARTTTESASILRFLDVLADFQKVQQDSVMVSWLGGEPLLIPTLPSLTAHATERGLRISATTNGTSLGSASARRHLLDHYSELTISLDAADESHDAIRSSPGLFKALQKNVTELSNARRMSERPLKLRVNTVLLKTTIDRFPAIARELAAWGVDELTFNLLGGRDRPEFFQDNRPLPSQFTKFAKQLTDLRAELTPRGLTIAGSNSYIDRLSAAGRNIPRPIQNCGPGEKFLFIDERGMVSPCPFTSQELGIHLTELNTAADIAALARHFSQARHANRPSACNDCPSTQVFEKFSNHAA